MKIAGALFFKLRQYVRDETNVKQSSSRLSINWRQHNEPEGDVGMKKTSAVLTLFFALGAWGSFGASPASAGESRSVGAAMQSVVPMVSCTHQMPSPEWVPQMPTYNGGWDVACAKCKADGRVRELQGYLALCRYISGGYAVQLHLYSGPTP